PGTARRPRTDLRDRCRGRAPAGADGRADGRRRPAHAPRLAAQEAVCAQLRRRGVGTRLSTAARGGQGGRSVRRLLIRTAWRSTIVDARTAGLAYAASRDMDQPTHANLEP